MQVARIGMVDDHEQIIRGVRSTLDEQSDLRLVAGAASVADLLAITTDLDLVLLDLSLDDDHSPTENIAALTEHSIPVLVYTSAEDFYQVREAAAAEVIGVLPKNTSEAELLEAIRAARFGVTIPSVDWACAIDSDPDFVYLSPQQRRVLRLYAAGESQDRVAHELGISKETVNDYVTRIRQKYAAAGRAAPTKSDLYGRSIEDGWSPTPRRKRRMKPR